MKSGEKRSLTSSLNKCVDLFIEHNQGDILSFATKDNLVNSFFTYWLNYSKSNKLSWCKTNNYDTLPNFKNDMFIKIIDLFHEEISLLNKMNNSNHLPPLRSKKKRLRKKRQKMIRELT